MKVGDSARRSRQVERADIALFAAMTGDHNPIHFDEQLAARSRFGGIVVQGGVTTGLLNALVAQDLPGPGSVFLHTDLNFRAPVRPGDLITAEATVTGVRGDKPVSTLRLSIVNQHGSVVLDGSAVVWRDPTVAAAGARPDTIGSHPIESSGTPPEKAIATTAIGTHRTQEAS